MGKEYEENRERMEIEKGIYIKGNVPSSKNSKQWTGKALISSKTVSKYKSLYEYQYMALKSKFRAKLSRRIDLKKPYKVGFYFIRDSKRRFDYINICQLPCDLMVKYGWIDDDNADEIIPVFLGYEVNKEHAGVIISLL